MKYSVIIVLFILLTNCANKIAQKDWEKIYEKEILIAIYYEDNEAILFFFEELIKEKEKNKK